jgi:outer membrane protein assembly factor BamB
MQRRVLLGVIGSTLSFSGCLRLTETSETANSEPSSTGTTPNQPSGPNTRTERSEPSSWTVSLNAPGTTGPLIQGNTVYIGSVDNNIYALNAATGDERFRTDIGDEVGRGLVYKDRTIYGSTPSGFFGVNSRNGDIVLNTDHSVFEHYSPVIRDQTLYYSSSDLIAVDLDSGETKWTRETPSVRFGGGIAFANGVLLASDLGNTDTSESEQSYIYGLEPADGDTRWRTHFTADALVSSAAASPEHGIAIFTGTKNGMIAGLDVTTGEERWRVQTDSERIGQLVLGEDTIYIVPSGELYAYDIQSGEQRWSLNIETDYQQQDSIDGLGYVQLIEGRLFASASVYVEEEEDLFVKKLLRVAEINPSTGTVVASYTLPAEHKMKTSFSINSDWIVYTTQNSTVRQTRLQS